MHFLNTYFKSVKENFIISHFFLCMLYLTVLMISTNYETQKIFTMSSIFYLFLILGVFALTPLQTKILDANLSPDRNVQKKVICFFYISSLLIITIFVLWLTGLKIEYRMLFALSVVLVGLSCEWRSGLVMAALISSFIFLYDYVNGSLQLFYELDIITAAFFLSLTFSIGKISESNNQLVKKLLLERAFTQNLLDNLPLAVITSDSSGQIIKCNNTTEKIINLPLEKVYSMDEKSFWHYICQQAEAENYLSLSGEEVTNKEIKFDNRYLLINRRRLNIDGENNIGTITLLQDITERKKYEDRMKRVSTLSVVGEMAAATAHEIKNPLTTIHGFIQLFLQKQDQKVSELKDQFELVLREINRINKIMTDFLQLARPRKPQPARINPSPLLEDTLKMVKSDATYRKVKLLWDIPDKLPEIYGDPDQLKQVILNLVQNAIQACSLGGRVNVTCQAQNDSWLQLIVEDSGPGIPHELVDKLFQPFFTTKEGGTGLGLPISRRIVEEHGGSIDIDIDSSNLGGAKFVVNLPILEDEEVEW